MRSASIPSLLPEGFDYRPDWITAEQEHDLVSHIETLLFSEIRMHGVIAKRKVVHFGWDYGYDSWTILPTEPIPEWLLPLRNRAADVLRVSERAIEEVLVTRYEPGPSVLGVSLVGSCRMRFQRIVRGTRHTAETVLTPRSRYVLAGAARSFWQHSIPPTKDLRYSITFRTLNKADAAVV